MNSMSDMLASVKNKIVVKKDDIKDPSSSPMLLGKDGEDHINIWESGDTELGQLLSHRSRIPLRHNIFGKFVNIESFWHYIRSKERDDRIRTMGGQKLHAFAKKLTDCRVVNFKAIIMDANWQRVSSNLDLVTNICDSSLPFDCYYVNRHSGVRVRPTFFKWFIQGYEEIRKALKESREPNFQFLLDEKDSTIYQYAIITSESMKKEATMLENKKKQFNKIKMNNKPVHLAMSAEEKEIVVNITKETVEEIVKEDS